MFNGFLILDNENREYSACSGELYPARSDWQLQITLPCLAGPGPSPSNIIIWTHFPILWSQDCLTIVTAVLSRRLSSLNTGSLSLTPSLSHSLTLSLSNVFPFWPAGQHWAGGVTKLLPAAVPTQLRQPDRTCSGLQWAMQTCSNMPLPTACITSPRLRLDGWRNMAAVKGAA